MTDEIILDETLSEGTRYPYLTRLKNLHPEEGDFEEAVEELLAQRLESQSNFNWYILPAFYGGIGYGAAHLMGNNFKPTLLVPAIGIGLWAGHQHTQIIKKIKSVKLPAMPVIPVMPVLGGVVIIGLTYAVYKGLITFPNVSIKFPSASSITTVSSSIAKKCGSCGKIHSSGGSGAYAY